MQVYKAAWCVFHARGKCTRGNNCSFAHSAEELRQLPDLRKTKLCNAFLGGQCSNNNCSYAHGLQELRDFPGKKGLCRLYREGKCLHGSSCKYAHALGELEVGYVFAQPFHEQQQQQQQVMMAHREQPQTQQHQTQSFLPDSSLPQDLLLLQQLAMQQAQGKLSSFSNARQQQHQQQQMLQQHQQLLMLLEAEAAGKAALAAQDRQKAQVARRQQQQQQYQEQPQQHLKRQLQDPQRRCIASELEIQHGQQQEQPDVLSSYRSKMVPGTLQPQQKKQKEPTLQKEAGTAARSPGALHFRSPASKVPAFSLRALATTQQQVQQDSEEQLLENIQSSDNWNEVRPMMQLPANAAEGTEQQPQQQQQQQQSELEDIVSRQQSMQQRLLLQQQALPSGYQQTFPDTALQHGWQRPAAGSADEAQGTATTAAAPGYTYRELSSWGQAVSRSTASTATGDDCYSFASLAAAAAVRKAEQGLKVPTPESLQRQQKPLTQQQQPQVLQKLPQQSLTRQGHELLQAVELLRQQHQYQQQGEHERKEANWALQPERCSAEVAPAVSPFGSYSLRELQNRMTALTLQPQQQQQEEEPLEQTRQRQQHHLEQHRQIEGLLARLSREQAEGIGKQLGGDSLSSVDTQQQQQHQQQIEQQQLFPKLQLPSGVTGTAPASYRLGKSPLHRPDGEDTPCVQHSLSTIAAVPLAPRSCSNQSQKLKAVTAEGQKQQAAPNPVALEAPNRGKPHSEESTANLPQRLATIRSEDEGQESDEDHCRSEHLQQQPTLEQELTKGRMPLAA